MHPFLFGIGFVLLGLFAAIGMARTSSRAKAKGGLPKKEGDRYFLSLSDSERTEVSKRIWFFYTAFFVLMVACAGGAILSLILVAVLDFFVPAVRSAILIFHGGRPRWLTAFVYYDISVFLVAIIIATITSKWAKSVRNRVRPESKTIVKENDKYYAVAKSTTENPEQRTEVARNVYLKHSTLSNLSTLFQTIWFLSVFAFGVDVMLHTHVLSWLHL